MRKVLRRCEAERHDLMKVRLLRDARINHKAGEIVEVSPAECGFLVSVGSAVEVAVKPPVMAETAKADPVEKPVVERKTRKK